MLFFNLFLSSPVFTFFFFDVMCFYFQKYVYRTIGKDEGAQTTNFAVLFEKRKKKWKTLEKEEKFSAARKSIHIKIRNEGKKAKKAVVERNEGARRRKTIQQVGNNLAFPFVACSEFCLRNIFPYISLQRRNKKERRNKFLSHFPCSLNFQPSSWKLWVTL